jgi:phage terminase large subunit-like protein
MTTPATVKRRRSAPAVEVPTSADNVVDAYARDVVEGRVPAGKYHRLSCERHLRDRAREGAADFPYRFDLARAERFFRFASKLKHYKGEWAGTPIALQPFQQFRLGSIFGWRHVATGLRRFRTAYNEIPRKNGKSLEAAVVALYVTFFDGEPGAEGYCLATKLGQALFVFRDAKKLTTSSGLKDRIKVHARALTRADSESKLAPLGANPEDGLNPHLIIIDEFHKLKTRDLVDVMETATGARRQPLNFQITTAGDDPVSPCGDQHDYACKVLDGVFIDETFFAFIAHADDDDDWLDERTWRKANPNFGVSINPTICARSRRRRAICRAPRRNSNRSGSTSGSTPTRPGCRSRAGAPAKRLVARGHARPRVLDRRRPLEQDRPGRGRVRVSAGELPPPGGAGRGRRRRAARGRGAGELAGGRRAARAVALSRPPVHPGRYRARAIAARPRAVRAMDRWRRRPPDHDARQPDRSRRDLRRRRSRRRRPSISRCASIGFDPWNAGTIEKDLENAGFVVVEVPQTFAHLSGPAKEFEADVLDAHVDAGGNPVLAWNAANAVVQRDGKDNIQPIKKRSRGRIDGIVASLIARKLAAGADDFDGGDDFEEFEEGLVVL